MGRVRNKMVKRAARQLIERHYPKMTLDFDINKRVLDEVAQVPSKRVRNKIAGYSARLMRRIQRGPVRGISLKLQEEERERRLDFLPEKSFVEKETVDVDQATAAMLKRLSLKVEGLKVQKTNNKKFNFKGGKGAGKKTQRQRQFGAAFRQTTPKFGLEHPQKQYNQGAIFAKDQLKRVSKTWINDFFYRTVLQKTSTYFALVGVLAIGFDYTMRETTNAYVAKFNKGRSFEDMMAIFPEVPPGLDLDEDE